MIYIFNLKLFINYLSPLLIYNACLLHGLYSFASCFSDQQAGVIFHDNLTYILHDNLTFISIILIYVLSKWKIALELNSEIVLLSITLAKYLRCWSILKKFIEGVFTLFSKHLD